MFKPLSLCVGWRYTRAKRSNRFVSFIALASMLGIALGMTVLITVLSVMNGFNQIMEQQVFANARHVTIQSFFKEINNTDELIEQAFTIPQVTAAASVIDGQGLLVYKGLNQPAAIIGILPDEEKQISDMRFVEGSFDALQAGDFGIVISYSLSRYLAIDIDDQLTLVTTEAAVTPAGLMPRFRRFTVVGIFDNSHGVMAGSQFQLAYIHLKDAQILFRLNNNVTGIQLRTDNLYAAPLVAAQLNQLLPIDYYASDWTREYGALFQAVDLEKKMMFLVLVFIIAVAAFNLVSTLVMTVNDKRSEIAIMRTIGATPAMIMRIFMWQGTLVGIIGTTLGIIGGVLLSWNITAIVAAIEKYFQIQFLSSNIYIVNYLPSSLDWSDVQRVALTALILSFLATIYPAWKAGRTQPAEVLRYD